MEILNTFKNDITKARKEGNKEELTVLNTFKASLESIVKAGQENTPDKNDVTPDEFLKVVKSTMKGLNETKENLLKFGRDTSKVDFEISVYEKYTEMFGPKQLSDSELEEAIKSAISEVGEKSMKNMGKVMGILNAKYKGQFDGGTASQMVKKELQS